MEHVAGDISAFHHVFYATMVMTGPGPLRAAISENPAPASHRTGIGDFAAALAATQADRSGDPYDEMHAALELVLDDDQDLDGPVRYLLAITTLAARFTSTDANPNRGLQGYVSAPATLTHYLLAEPVLHATLIMHRRDDDNALRARMLALAAQVAPIAAGDLATEFPGLAGEGLRLEPASRMRARHWIEAARRLADDHGTAEAADLTPGPDACTLAHGIGSGQDLPADWPIERLTSAAAEAASAILHSAGAAESAGEVFEET